jgi:hypothetical protein
LPGASHQLVLSAGAILLQSKTIVRSAKRHWPLQRRLLSAPSVDQGARGTIMGPAVKLAVFGEHRCQQLAIAAIDRLGIGIEQLGNRLLVQEFAQLCFRWLVNHLEMFHGTSLREAADQFAHLAADRGLVVGDMRGHVFPLDQQHDLAWIFDTPPEVHRHNTRYGSQHSDTSILHRGREPLFVALFNQYLGAFQQHLSLHGRLELSISMGIDVDAHVNIRRGRSADDDLSPIRVMRYLGRRGAGAK